MSLIEDELAALRIRRSLEILPLAPLPTPAIEAPGNAVAAARVRINRGHNTRGWIAPRMGRRTTSPLFGRATRSQKVPPFYCPRVYIVGGGRHAGVGGFSFRDAYSRSEGRKK